MPITDNKLSSFTFNHSDQENKLYESYTATEIKSLFDLRGVELQTKLNALIDFLQSTTVGDSAAKAIGVEAITGVTGSNLLAVLQNLKSQIDGVALGAIPDASITTAKLAGASITTAKIVDASITTAKIADSSISTTKIADASITTSKLTADVKNDLSPAGSVVFFATNPPTGYLKCNGAAISRTTYSTLLSAIGTTFGAGDGSTTFNIPDLRGEFIRGYDDNRWVDSGRAFGSFQEATSIEYSTDITSNMQKLKNTDGTDGTGSIGTGGSSGNPGTTTYYKVRPRNVALMACIKY